MAKRMIEKFVVMDHNNDEKTVSIRDQRSHFIVTLNSSV